MRGGGGQSSWSITESVHAYNGTKTFSVVMLLSVLLYLAESCQKELNICVSNSKLIGTFTFLECNDNYYILED